MDKNQQISNLKSFGYTEREATFLAIAALHSGYFLRRQYCAFSGTGFGTPDNALIEKTLELRHVREISLRYHRKLYSIQSKPLFEALGETDNRNRRLHEPQTIKARLMGLDYVLGKPNACWYPTEDDRVSLFVDDFGIEKQHLPVKRYVSRNGGRQTLRWFVDKPPVFTEPPDKTVRICFADPGYHTGDAFASFLSDYRPLFARLERFGIIYIACYAASAHRGQAIFDRSFCTAAASPLDPVHSDLTQYFEDRYEHEMKGLAGFDHERLNRYRDARRQFANRRVDELFALWKEEGAAAMTADLCPESAPDFHRRCSFSIEIPAQNYELFGGFPKAAGTGNGRKDGVQVSL